MMNIMKLFVIVMGILLPPCQAEAADSIVIYLQFFQGVREEGRAGLTAVERLQIESRPELAAIKAGLGESEAALTTNVLEALLDIYDLQAVDDLFRHEADWDGKASLLDDWIIGKTNSFRVKLKPKKLSSQQIALHVGIVRTKTAARTMIPSGAEEPIAAQDLVLNLGEPVIVGLPNPNGDYFLSCITQLTQET